MFQLSELKSFGPLNNRESTVTREQNFDVRWRRFVKKNIQSGVKEETSRYYISNKVWDEYKFDKNGLMIAPHPEHGAIFVVLPEDHPKVSVLGSARQTGKLKPGQVAEKGKGFKAENLDKLLAEKGIISMDIVGDSQFLTFAKVGEADGYPVLALVKGEGSVVAFNQAESTDEANQANQANSEENED